MTTEKDKDKMEKDNLNRRPNMTKIKILSRRPEEEIADEKNI